MIEPEDGNNDALTALVWTLRIVLPCLLFWISFGPRLKCPWRWKQHSRDIMLAHWKFVKDAGGPAPKAVENLVMVDAQTAPMLFVDTAKRQKPERSEKTERHERERGERSDRTRGQDRRERKQSAPDAMELDASDQAQGQYSEEKPEITEELMYWESLVNFVAFGRHEQQRHFLVNSICIPPPPPRVQKAPNPSDPESVALLAVAIERANGEAQMVLKGAIQAGRVGFRAAHALYTQMADHDIAIQSLTFELIIESCISANELQQASDYLMRMEAAGQTPSNELLDRVMDLYLLHKRTEHDEKPKAEENIQIALPAGLVAMGSGHQLDVAGLKRLVVPPPPPPTRQAPVNASVYAGHGTGNYNHMMSHSIPMEVPQLLLPWQARLPYRNFNGGSLAAQSLRRKDDDSKKFPAFSIPDEFVAQRKPDEQDSGNAAGNSAEDVDDELFTELTELPPVSETVKEDAPELVSSSMLSADAAEFVMPQLPGDTQFLDQTGNSKLDMHYGASSEHWQYMPQHSDVASGWAENASLPTLYEAVGGMGSSFEWSVQAPEFTPMVNRSLPEMDQATTYEWDSLNQDASDFVPGHTQMQRPLPVGPVSPDEFYRPEGEVQIH